MLIDLSAAEMSRRDLYKLLITIVTPRPIALVSSLSAEGVANLAPFSWYNMVSVNPPALMFVPGYRRDGSEKDTLANVKATQEFVVATVTADILDPMVHTAAELPPGESEFDFSGLTAKPAVQVEPALVAESPVNFECRLLKIVTLSDKPGGTNVVFGEIVAIHVEDDVLDGDGLVDPEKLHAVGRLGRDQYAEVTEPIARTVPEVKR